MLGYKDDQQNDNHLEKYIFIDSIKKVFKSKFLSTLVIRSSWSQILVIHIFPLGGQDDVTLSELRTKTIPLKAVSVLVLVFKWLQ